MRKLRPKTTFAILSLLSVVFLIVSRRSEIAWIMGLSRPPLGAYYSLLIRPRELLAHWGLDVSHWYWVLFFPLISLTVSMFSMPLVFMALMPITRNRPLIVDLFAGMAITSFILCVLAGLIAVGLDLLGMVPRHQPK